MRLILRGGQSAEAHGDIVLAAGEPAAERDTSILKVGDGVSTWDELPPVNESVWTAAIAAAVAAIEAGDVDSVNGRTGTVTGLAEQADLDAEAALARNADNLTSGTVADVRIASTIARDSEVTAAVAAEAVARDAAIAAAVVGLLDYRGSYNASGNAFPSSGGSGSAGAVAKGDFWMVSTGGTLGGSVVAAGDLVIALQDAPGQTAGNWDLVDHNLGYTPVDSAVLTTDGDVLTRAAGVPARITRAALAADTAFSGTYAPYPRTIDVPAFTPTNVVNGTHTFTQNSGAWRGGYRSLVNLNEYAEWIVPLDDGSWTIAVETANSTNAGGTLEVTVGGVLVATIDTAANSNATRTTATGITVATPGLVPVRFTVTTKAGGSSSYVSRLNGFTMALPGAL